MSNNSKKIIINPELFKVNRNKGLIEKRDKTKMKPIISPNVIKNKFMKRIKEHKLKEIEKANQKGMDDTNEKKNNMDANKYTTEFNESIEYLQNISKQNKINTEKMVSKEKIQKQKEYLENKTLKHNPYSYVNTPVNIELPEVLQENIVPISIKNTLVPTSSLPFQLNYQIPSNVPYGILKGGKQPTFREWNKTRKNIDSQPSSHVSMQSIVLNEREHKMNILKEKIKEKQQQASQISSPLSIPYVPASPLVYPPPETDIMMTHNLIQKPMPTVVVANNLTDTSRENDNTHKHDSQQLGNANIVPATTSSRFMKRITKKIIKRKYTLGKSKLKKMVSVLLKDQNTRKRIVNAQKDLKHHPITDVKKYLKSHHLIKVGTHAPNDVIRKLYESAMLAGEITNINTETLLHNFMKDEDTIL